MKLMLCNKNLEIKAEFSNTSQIRNIINNIKSVKTLKLKNGEYIESFHVGNDFEISSNSREVKIFLLKGDILYFLDERFNPISKPRYF